MKFDDILLHYVGDFGLYQKIQLILVCAPAIFLGMHSLSWAFTGASINYRCLLIDENDTDAFPFTPLNYDYAHWLNVNQSKKMNKCERIVNQSVYEWTIPESSFIETETCKNGYKWDTSEIQNSAIKRWQFACKDGWLKAFVHSFYYIGQFFGSVVFGILADKFGRKNIFFFAIFIQIACGTTMAFVPYWPLFTFLRFCLGFAHPGVFVTAVVIGVEMVGPQKRIMSSSIITMFFAVGSIILGVLAYFFRDYEQLQLAISIPAVIFVVYWWIIPESARWLIMQKRYKEAEIILQRIARVNNRHLPESWCKSLEAEEEKSKAKNVDGSAKKYGFFDMFRTPSIRKHSLTFFVCWPVVSMAYYGLAMNPSFMGGNRYTTFIFGGTLEIAAAFLVLFTLNVFGRKLYGVVGFQFAALCLILATVMPESYSTTRMVFVCVGKMALTAVYGVLYVFTPELFPTVIRTTAVGSCSMIARLGGITASYVSLWLAEIYPSGVALFFGIMCMISGTLLLLLPETNGQPQIETMEDAEQLAKKKQKWFIFGWQLKKEQNNQSTEKSMSA